MLGEFQDTGKAVTRNPIPFENNFGFTGLAQVLMQAGATVRNPNRILKVPAVVIDSLNGVPTYVGVRDGNADYIVARRVPRFTIIA